MSPWAALVERLIAAGHPNALDYIPQQAIAFDTLAQSRRRIEMHDSYSISRLAHYADKKVEEKFLKGLKEE